MKEAFKTETADDWSTYTDKKEEKEFLSLQKLKFKMLYTRRVLIHMFPMFSPAECSSDHVVEKNIQTLNGTKLSL